MDLRIYSAHTGRVLSVPYNVNSLPELKRWIAKELGITEKYLVLMTPRGSQVKPQYWADESELFAFDREFLSKRSSAASSTAVDLPSIAIPPESISPKATLKAHLTHLRTRATWARNVANQATQVQKKLDSTNEEIVVLQKSAKIALVNLGNVSRSLQRAFTDTEMLADKKLQARKELLMRIPSGVTVLNTIKVHPVFGKEEQTLGEFFDNDDIENAVKVCGKTHSQVEQRITELKNTMEEFIKQGEGLKAEVLGWTVKQIPDGGHVREITLIADKIERDFHHISSMHDSPTAVSSSIRSFQNHTREYIPSIIAAATTLLETFKATNTLRHQVSVQSQTYLQRLSSAQERMVSIGPQLAEADELFGQSQENYNLLREVEKVAENYGEALLEGYRRGLWKVRRANRLEKARDDITMLRMQELRARKAWEDVDGGIIWSFVDELSDDESSMTHGIDSPVNRKDIETYISAISKSLLFQRITLSLKDHLSVLITSVQTPQDAATSPLHLTTEDLSKSHNYEDLLREKTRAEERARNFESRVKNLEEMLHRQFRTPPRNFSPLPGSLPSPRLDDLDRSFAKNPEMNILQNRVQELERDKQELYQRFTETTETKSDLLANLEEQTKLFQVEREDFVRKTNHLEREVERCETEINRFEEMVPKMEGEMETMRKGRQNLLREMNLLQTESGAKIKELEDAKTVAEEKVGVLELQVGVHERDGKMAVTEIKRVTEEWKKAISEAENANAKVKEIRQNTQKYENIESELSDAKQKIASMETEKEAVGDEFSAFRDRIADILGLEHRSSESLLHAISQSASKEQRLTEVPPLCTLTQSDATIASLSKESRVLTAQLSKFKSLCASRTLKARDLTQRLYTQHTRCKQLLETLGLQVKSTGGSVIQYNATDFLEPDDLDLLYWMESGDSDEEADKYSRYLDRIVLDLDAFAQVITNRVKDAEKYAKKWQKEARAYRDKSKRATVEAENKIAFRQFKEGDLALFLPTNNGRPWAAFNVNAPHYFLREIDAHRLGGGRDWLLARITQVEERTVDLADHPEHNPFDLADGLRWYYLDAVEEKGQSRELTRSLSLQKSEKKSVKKRMSQSTPGLIPGREDGVALVESVIQEEGEERV